MPQVIIITQCRWCGKVLAKNGDWVDLGLPILYLEFYTAGRLNFPVLQFDLQSCTDCETKECDKG